MTDYDVGGPESTLMIGSYASDYSIAKKKSATAVAKAVVTKAIDEHGLFQMVLYRLVRVFVLTMKGTPILVFVLYVVILWRSATKEMDEELRASWEIIRSGRKSLWQVWKSAHISMWRYITQKVIRFVTSVLTIAKTVSDQAIATPTVAVQYLSTLQEYAQGYVEERIERSVDLLGEKIKGQIKDPFMPSTLRSLIDDAVENLLPDVKRVMLDKAGEYMNTSSTALPPSGMMKRQSSLGTAEEDVYLDLMHFNSRFRGRTSSLIPPPDAGDGLTYPRRRRARRKRRSALKVELGERKWLMGVIPLPRMFAGAGGTGKKERSAEEIEADGYLDDLVLDEANNTMEIDDEEFDVAYSSDVDDDGSDEDRRNGGPQAPSSTELERKDSFAAHFGVRKPNHENGNGKMLAAKVSDEHTFSFDVEYIRFQAFMNKWMRKFYFVKAWVLNPRRTLRSLRAFIIYHSSPFDQSIWECMWNPWWLFFSAVGFFPYGFGVLWWLLMFMMHDKGDEYQLSQFIVGFQTAKFLSQGCFSLILGAFLYYTCATSSPVAVDANQCVQSGPRIHHMSDAVFFLLQILLIWACFFLLPHTSPCKVVHDEVYRYLILDAEKHAERLEQRLGHRLPGGRLFYLFWWDTITIAVVVLLACVAYFGLKQELWQFETTLYWLRTLYGLFSLPFVVFKIPIIRNILIPIKATGYDRFGNTVLSVKRNFSEPGVGAGLM